MSETKTRDWADVVIAAAIAFALGILVGSLVAFSEARKQTVQHGYAAYDTITGEWHWK